MVSFDDQRESALEKVSNIFLKWSTSQSVEDVDEINQASESFQQVSINLPAKRIRKVIARYIH